MSSSQPTILFLHGFAESREVWTEFTRDFPEGYRLLTLNLLGHGTNVHDIRDYSMEAQARYVAEQLRQKNVERALLVCHSMGGYVALAFAERYPDMVAGLVLFHSTALPDSEEKKANRDKNQDFVRRHGVEKFMESFIRPLFAPANREQLLEQREFLEDIGRATPEATVLGALEAMKNRPDRTKVLREARFPVLFIAGKDDVAVPTDALLPQLALPAQSHALLLSNVGHLGYFEEPELTRRAVVDFAGVVFEAAT
ncbi:pimeloyl-ACP methyl ester carboxylesterase [Hymenobacter luteus]|uniref:Pimeloyl-ACP methyl ester carboxylesterase n=2 Tax=Hymenobacter TaxID=89966 RepID=A0A7W9SXP9_9BACT|nr:MULTISPECIES: alpha/beta fold hydrolase [Hymenobacter]MBB4599885.1 pimeloyl-ACP methyl ester carboxylesterase [Hymenobacter latericoloratus]MBB6057805.1 pimeloyl-ACP methyl ester carboxylesterase [Hymenobacter luteus]